MDLSTIKSIAKFAGIPVVVIFVLWLIISNAENIILLKGQLFQWFSKIHSKAGKTALSSKLRGSVLKATNDFGAMNNEILPKDLKIKWIENGKAESFVSDNQVVIRIKKSNNPNENLISAASSFVNAGMLYNHKRYLDNGVIKASNLAMIRKIVQNSGKNSVTYFDENYLPRYVDEDSEIKYKYAQLRTIDKNGMFINILLNEYRKAADTIFGEEIDPCLVIESRQLLDFLYNIATRDSDEDTDLKLMTNYFNVSIILAAKTKTLKYKWIYPHIKRIKENLSEGIDTVYILGIGSKTRIAKEIADHINRDEELVAYATGNSYKHIFKDGTQRDAMIFEISRKF